MFRSSFKTALVRFLPAMMIAFWAATVVGGMTWLAVYGNQPGPSTADAPHWPADSQLSRSVDRPTLVVFLHPHCPCSRAVLEEAAITATRAEGRFVGYFVVARPAGVEPGWERTALWDAAAAVPGFLVCADDDEREARRFAAATSGHAMLFAPDGKCLFSGGITRSRGHAGDNVGRTAVVSRLLDGSAETTRTPVFGCPLFVPGDLSGERTEP
jgi:hypothetical protein